MPRILVAVVLAFAVIAVPASAAPKKGPGGAAFYKPPKHLKGKHGGLIWVHKQTGSDALKGARNELLLYRSKDLSGKVTAVSGSVAIPKGKAPKGGWPIITYAHGTTGAADACAPTKGYNKDNLNRYAFPLLQRWIKAGFAVVRTDYDGLGTPGVHQYLVGTSEGRSVLDAVLAARAFNGKLSKRYMIAGHSQGGHAALFAAAAAPKYLHGLKLRGTVAFAPASHLKTQFQASTGLCDPGRRPGRDRRARPARDRQLGLEPRRAEPPDAGCARAVPADQDGVLRRAEQAELVRRPEAQRHPQVRPGPHRAAQRGRRERPGAPADADAGADRAGHRGPDRDPRCSPSSSSTSTSRTA